MAEKMTCPLFAVFTWQEKYFLNEWCPVAVRWLHYTKITPVCAYLDVSTGVDFVNSISRGSTRFSVQVVTLNKHCMVTKASHPDISLTFTLQLDPFTNVKPDQRAQCGIKETWVTAVGVGACWCNFILAYFPIILALLLSGSCQLCISN